MELINLRKKHKLTQEQISKMLNMSQSTYQHYENGRAEPNIDTLCKLADYYNVSLDYLIGRERPNDISYLTPKQLSAVSLIKELNDDNLTYEIGRLTALIEQQRK